MAFLDKDELRTTATISIIDKITQEDESTVDTIIEECIDEMKTYMSSYDVASIFSATGGARSKVILRHLKSLVTHQIFLKGGSEFGAENSYQSTKWLEKVSKGAVTLSLPLAHAASGSSQADPLFGGDPSYESEF